MNGATITELQDLAERICERAESASRIQQPDYFSFAVQNMREQFASSGVDSDTQRRSSAELYGSSSLAGKESSRETVSRCNSDLLASQIADLDSVGPCEALVFGPGYFADAQYTENQECGSSGKLIHCTDGEYRYICSRHEKEWR